MFLGCFHSIGLICLISLLDLSLFLPPLLTVGHPPPPPPLETSTARHHAILPTTLTEFGSCLLFSGVFLLLPYALFISITFRRHSLRQRQRYRDFVSRIDGFQTSKSCPLNKPNCAFQHTAAHSLFPLHLGNSIRRRAPFATVEKSEAELLVHPVSIKAHLPHSSAALCRSDIHQTRPVHKPRSAAHLLLGAAAQHMSEKHTSDCRETDSTSTLRN